MFVMVEVYHSLRLCCAASHELMMNGRRDRERERERAEGCIETTESWTGKGNVNQRLARDIRRCSFLRGKMRKRIGEKKRPIERESEIARKREGATR